MFLDQALKCCMVFLRFINRILRVSFQFRPILAAFITPSFKLAKFLVPTLSSLNNNEFTCKNSYQFSKDIFNLNGSKL